MTDEKDSPKWVVQLKRAGYVATALIALGTLGYNVNGYFQTAEAATEKYEEIILASDTASYKANRDREEGDIRLQIELIQLELNLGNPTESRKAFLEARLTVLLNRLAVLEGVAS